MLLFRLTIKTYLLPQLLVYLPKFVPVHGPTCSFSYFHSDEPFLSTRQRFYCSTRPQMYLFITILFCMSTDVPVHHYTCSVYFFFFGITCTMTVQLISGYLCGSKMAHITLTITIYFLHPSGKLKLSFDRTTKNISQ